MNTRAKNNDQMEDQKEEPQCKFSGQKLFKPAMYMFGEYEIMTIADSDGEIWFKASEIAEALELADPETAIALYVDARYQRTLDKIESKMIPTDLFNFTPLETIFINEPGLYLFVLRSQRPSVENMVHWIVENVLTSVRDAPFDTPFNGLREKFAEAQYIINKYKEEKNEKLLSKDILT